MAAYGVHGSFGIPRRTVVAASAILMTVLLSSSLLLAISTDSSADDSGELDGIHWDLTGNVLTFTGTGALKSYGSEENDRPWAKAEVQTVVIGNGITSVGSYLFSEHSNLINVTIGDDVTVIGSHAFNNCHALQTVHLPNRAQTIGDYAFYDCTAISQIYFSVIDSLGDHAFDNVVFYSHDDALLDTTKENLMGKRFIRDYSGMLKDEGWRVTFDSMGGTPVGDTYVINGETLSMPSSEPTKGPYTFGGWYMESACVTPYNFADPVTNMLTLYAEWDDPLTPVNVTFDPNTGAGAMPAQVMTFNLLTPLTANAFTKENHHFTGWNTASDGSGTSYSDCQTVAITADITLYAQWAIDTYPVRFISEGTDFQVFNLSLGDTIPKPTAYPSKASDSKYDYEFGRWEGYIEGMTLTTAGTSFDAAFIRMPKMDTDVSGNIRIDGEGKNVAFTKARIETIVSMAATDDGMTLTVNLEDAEVVFDNKALRSLKPSDAEVSVTRLSYGDLSDAEKEIIGENIAYEIGFGENRNFMGGKVTITIPYTLVEGKEADDLYVAYISDGSVEEEIGCSYADGGLTFSTGHLSIYAMLYKEAKRTDFLADLDFASFLTIGIILAIALSGIILFVLKKLK